MSRHDSASIPSSSANLPARTGRQSSGALSRPLGGFFDESPFQMMRRMQADMDRMFGPFFGGMPLMPTRLPGFEQMEQQMQQLWQPNVDISEDQNEFRIEADLPGVQPDNIDVQIQNGYLVLRSSMNQESETPQAGGQPNGQQATGGTPQGNTADRQYHRRERRYGYFERVFALPENVDENQIQCDFQHGVLICHLPKKALAPHLPEHGRRIPINAGTTIPAPETARTTAGQMTGQQQPPKTAADQALHEEEAHEQEVSKTPHGAGAKR